MMVRRGSTEERWRRAIEGAFAPERLEFERDALADEVSRRLWRANGGTEWTGTGQEGVLLALEIATYRYLQADMVRASAGLKFLQALEFARCEADYEDVPALEAEVRWTEAFLERSVFAAGPQGTTGTWMKATLPAGERLELLYAELVAAMQRELRVAA